MTLEAVQEGRETRVADFRARCCRCGWCWASSRGSAAQAPSYADYIVFGNAAMAALRQPVRVAGRGRSGRRLARADAGPVRRAGAQGKTSEPIEDAGMAAPRFTSLTVSDLRRETAERGVACFAVPERLRVAYIPCPASI